jgi:hypothetical protein
MSRPARAERCFPCHSPTLRPWIDGSRLLSVVLRGGALEPDPCAPAGKAQAKADANSAIAFPARGCRESFSLRRGLDSIQSCFKLSITFCSKIVWSPTNKKGDPVWVALVWLASAARDLAQGAPSEGYDVAGAANRIRAMPARQSTDGDSRFGEKFLGVRFEHHHGVACAGSQDRAKIGHWQDFQTKI